MSAITDKRLWILPLLLFSAWLVKAKGREGWTILAAAVLASGMGDMTSAYILKPAFGRQRPCVVLAEARCPAGKKESPSFPSNHAVNAFAAATAIGKGVPALWPWSLGVAVLVAFSRVYLGVHWPSDVLAGALIGIIFALFAWKIVGYASSRWKPKDAGSKS